VGKVDLAQLARHLRLQKDGVWIGPPSSAVSYFPAGNTLCWEVEQGSFWFAHRNACIVDLVRAYPPAGPLLDVGGGNGFVSVALRDNGVPPILLEPGIDGARNAQQRGLAPVICSTLEAAGFHDGSIPAVGLFDVLEHIADDGGFLREVRRILVPGGRLYLTVPAHRVLWSSNDVLTGHHRRYSLRSLGSVLSAAGFEVQRGTYFFVPLVPLVFLGRTVPSWLGLRRTMGKGRRAREHGMARSAWVASLRHLLRRERRALARGRRFSWGASCLVVARAR
jgi:SAM-dependent methyltransferase